MTRGWAARGVAIAAALAALAGCGEDVKPSPSSEDASAKTGAVSATSRPKVSKTASCDLLLGTGTAGPLQDILAIGSGGAVTSERITRAAKGSDMLRAVAKRSPRELEVRLVFVSDETDSRVAELRTDRTAERDSTPLMAAGLEVVQICEQGLFKPGSERSQKFSQTQTNGLRTTIPGNGTFQVGTDVAAGTYRTEGPSPDDGRSCVGYASTNPADLGTYLRGSTSNGPAFLRLEAGEYVTTLFCQPFEIQG